ncbi:MAG: hypothetical protein LBM98_06350 [Oscillospiraceae bacterium]|nr:hypothetical protein [Oscillospiraceae bacterium]
MKCWVCGNGEMALLRKGAAKPRPEDFKVTDRSYGTTLDLYKCPDCGFRQCDTADVTELYSEMTDEGYVESLPQRELQLSRLLKQTAPYIGGVAGDIRILDVGAGTGAFVRLVNNGKIWKGGGENDRFRYRTFQIFPESCERQRYSAYFAGGT